MQEWHLLEPIDDDDDIDIPGLTMPSIIPLPPGNPSRAYVPDNIVMHEVAEVLELSVPGIAHPAVYRPSAVAKKIENCRVKDVFLTGEVSFSHSSLRFLYCF